MDNTLLDDLRIYCARTGLAESTVCVRALSDSRFVGRWERRLARSRRDAARLRQYIADHPPEATTTDGKA